MKTFIWSLVTVAALTLTAVPAEARPKTKTVTRTTEVETRAPSSEEHVRLGFGFATYGGAGVGTGIGLAATHALSFWADLTEKFSLQVLAAIDSTSPFTAGFGSVFRYNVKGDSVDGFHLGLGFDLGNTVGGAGGTTFFANIFPVAGFHFGLGGALNNIGLSFDGGPVFAVTPNFQFLLQPISPIVGGAIHYFF